LSAHIKGFNSEGVLLYPKMNSITLALFLSHSLNMHQVTCTLAWDIIYCMCSIWKTVFSPIQKELEGKNGRKTGLSIILTIFFLLKG